MNDSYKVSLTVNGQVVERSVSSRLTLADFLRHELKLTGTHVGCEHGVCGACTVLLDQQPVRACLMFAVQAAEHEITTIEGLTPQNNLSSLQQRFCNHHALQCGFCTPGMVVTAEALLQRHPEVNAEMAREAISGNICRCTGYEPIVEAIVEEGRHRSSNVGAEHGE